jgi:hypothetical protein
MIENLRLDRRGFSTAQMVSCPYFIYCTMYDKSFLPALVLVGMITPRFKNQNNKFLKTI